MAIIYTKTDQGLIVTTGTGAPTHTAVAGDRYTNTSNGNTYQYTTGWNLMALSGDFTGGTVSGATNFTNGLTATTISATTISGTTFYGSGINLTGVVKGSGTTNYLPKWTGTTGLGNSQIYDDGTNVGIGIGPQSGYKLYVQGRIYGVGSIGTYGVYGQNIGDNTGTYVGVYGEGTSVEPYVDSIYVGGKFLANGSSYNLNYAAWLQDGTEGINKVLISATADGKSNWSSNLTGLTSVSATTINATNLYVTGGTQSIFSGNSSVELVRITQTGSGDAFVVEDSTNVDASHFVINASGNTAIGLTQPIGNDKLTVSGNTTVYGTVSATTYDGGRINNGKLIAITELTASTLATHTVASSTVFTAINCNSDATNRYAKITFTAPPSGIVEITFEADIVFTNSAAVQMVGLNTTTGSTTTPDNGWFRINGDADGSSATYRASFIISSLTPSTIYSYYVMTVCDFSGNIVRCGSRQTGVYVASADRPSPLRIYARDLGTTVITTNPSS